MQDRGFTMIELAATLAAGGALMALAQPVLNATGERSLRFKDADQLKDISQAHAAWAAFNRGAFPLPSDVDPLGNTVDVGQAADASQGVRLNHTSATFSILIFAGFEAPETFVSPAETNEGVQAYADYEFKDPQTAADPRLALWDPAFHATPVEDWNASYTTFSTDANPEDAGNNSYAQNPALGLRQSFWMATGDPDQAILANRGPIYEGAADAGWELTEGIGGTESTTLGFYADSGPWRGNVAYNDGRVDFEDRAAPEDLTWTFDHLPDGDDVHPDNLFVNENDDGETVYPEWAQPDGSAVIDGTASFLAADANANAYLRPVGLIDGVFVDLGTVGVWID